MHVVPVPVVVFNAKQTHPELEQALVSPELSQYESVAETLCEEPKAMSAPANVTRGLPAQHDFSDWV